MKKIYFTKKINITLYVALLVVFFSSLTSFSQKQNLVQKTTTLSLFRLKLHGLPNFLDECVFYYQEGATNGFDSDFDAYKLLGPNNAPHISIDNDSLLMLINGIPPVMQSYTTNILATTHATGNFTITASDVQGLPPGTCIFLKDLQTNTITNLLLNSYAFNLLSTTTTSRFVLTITYNTLPITSNLTSPTCQNPTCGKFTLSGNNGSPWNYVWKDSSGTIVKTSLGLSNVDSLSNLSSGSYVVEISSANDACLRNEVGFNIDSLISPIVAFVAPDTLTFGINQTLSTTNLSLNCSNYFWDFGDGIGNSSQFEDTYSFNAVGQYQVKLVGISASGCKDSTIKPITVINPGFTTSLTKSFKETIKVLNIDSKLLKIIVNSNTITNLDIKLIDMKGDKLLNQIFEVNGEVIIDLKSFVSGIYLLDISTDEKNHLTSKVIIQ